MLPVYISTGKSLEDNMQSIIVIGWWDFRLFKKLFYGFCSLRFPPSLSSVKLSYSMYVKEEIIQENKKHRQSPRQLIGVCGPGATGTNKQTNKE